MAYQFRCADAGCACKSEFKADSQNQLLAEVADHLRTKHDVQQVSKTLTNYVLKATRQT